jgi:hypothetical protein
MLTPSELELIAPIATSGKSAVALKLACDAALAFAEAYTDRRLTPGTFTEVYDGPGHEKLCLRNWPVSSVTDVRVDFGSPPTFGASTIVPASYYRLDGENGQLVLLTNLDSTSGTLNYGLLYGSRHYRGVTPSHRPTTWPRAYGVIQVTYTGGLTTTHRRWPAVKAALVELACYTLTYAPQGGVGATSISYIDVSQGVGFLTGQAGKPPIASAMAVLDTLKEIPFGTQIYG